MITGRYTYGTERIKVLTYGSPNKLIIGSFCSIADNITVYLGGNHRADRVTTFPFGHIFQNVFPSYNGEGHPASNGDVVIDNDVWISSGTTIMSGIHVGSGSILANNSHIISEVEPYSIMGGNPARLIKYRFSKEIVDKLLEIAWWDWPEEKINEFAPLLCNSNIEKFIEAVIA